MSGTNFPAVAYKDVGKGREQERKLCRGAEALPSDPITF